MKINEIKNSKIYVIFSLFNLIIKINSYYLSPKNSNAISPQENSNGDSTTVYSTYQSAQVNLAFQSINSTGSSILVPSTKSELDSSEIDNRILKAAPILGFYDQSNGELADWMSSIPDEIPIARMNIPGTHDSATWNYTENTQLALEPITGKLPPSIAFQCQDRSLFQMLGDGIRFFDLRVGFLPDHEQLGFYHASALLSSTATLSDALLGFYKWLDDHPSETVLLSIKVDNATFQDPPSKKQPSSVKLQETLYNLLTQLEIARTHWLQEDSQLGTLGESRGKLIFIQRIEWDYIRSNPTLKPIGIPLPPSKFKENDGNFTVPYDNPTNSKSSLVYIEDFFNLLPNPTTVKRKMDMKFEAVEQHLRLANSDNELDTDLSNSLFLTFASGGALTNVPPVTPKMLAIGIGKGQSLNDSVNNRVLDLIQAQYKKQSLEDSALRVRLGVVIFDWYHHVPTLIHDLISLNPTTHSS